MKYLLIVPFLFCLCGCAFSKRLGEEENKSQPALDNKTPIQVQVQGLEKIATGALSGNPVALASGLQDLVTSLIVAVSAAAGSAGGAHVATRSIKKSAKAAKPA